MDTGTIDGDMDHPACLPEKWRVAATAAQSTAS